MSTPYFRMTNLNYQEQHKRQKKIKKKLKKLNVGDQIVIFARNAYRTITITKISLKNLLIIAEHTSYLSLEEWHLRFDLCNKGELKPYGGWMYKESPEKFWKENIVYSRKF